jgi:hypothetical protein
MRALLGIGTGVLAIATSVPACFAVVDVDHFRTADTASTVADSSTPDAAFDPDSAGGTATYDNLKFSLVGMRPHLTQLFEYRIIDATNFIQSRGLINPLGGPDLTINAPLSIPKVNGPFHLDFYADVNHSGGYDGIGSVISNDHAWRIDPLEDYPSGSVSPVDGLIQVTFTHNTSFTDINQYPSGTPNPPRDTGLGATVHVSNAGALQGKLIQVRILDTDANHTVGLFRVPQIAQAAFDLTIPGVVESGGAYAALVYVDANGNGTYDNPAMQAGDLGWSVPGIADDTGFTVSLNAQTTETATADVGAP